MENKDEPKHFIESKGNAKKIIETCLKDVGSMLKEFPKAKSEKF